MEGVCNTFIQNQNEFLSCYVPFLLNMERGQRILAEYGGSFFTDKQREVEDELGLHGHYRRPKERLVEYYEALRDLCYCAQKQYLHGVSLVKVSKWCQVVSSCVKWRQFVLSLLSSVCWFGKE